MNDKDIDGETLLYKEAGAGYVKKCNKLLSRGANTEIANKNGRTPLSIAAIRGHENVCGVLLKAGAAVDHVSKYNGDTPLYWAAYGGHDKVCELLLEAGAAVDHVNKYGETPLS